MNLPRSSYYYKPREIKPEDPLWLKRIEELAEEFNGYGYRRIIAQVRREGIRVNHKKVLRLMRKQELICKPRHRWVRTTDSNHSYRIYPNLLPNCPATAPNQVWIADITYVRITTGFCLSGRCSGSLFLQDHRLRSFPSYRYPLKPAGLA